MNSPSLSLFLCPLLALSACLSLSLSIFTLVSSSPALCAGAPVSKHFFISSSQCTRAQARLSRCRALAVALCVGTQAFDDATEAFRVRPWRVRPCGRTGRVGAGWRKILDQNAFLGSIKVSNSLSQVSGYSRAPSSFAGGNVLMCDSMLPILSPLWVPHGAKTFGDFGRRQESARRAKHPTAAGCE